MAAHVEAAEVPLDEPRELQCPAVRISARGTTRRFVIRVEKKSQAPFERIPARYAKDGHSLREGECIDPEGPLA